MAALFNIISDSTCDFSLEDSQRLNIKILPFSYTEAGKPDGGFHGFDDQYRSRSPHEFYEAIKNGATPMTSQPSQLIFEEAFREALDTGLPTIVFCISSGLSGGYNGAVTALDRLKEELGKDDLPIYVIDCLITSSPMYMLVEEAARRRDAGQTVEEVYEWALDARFHARTIFMGVIGGHGLRAVPSECLPFPQGHPAPFQLGDESMAQRVKSLVGACPPSVARSERGLYARRLK